MLSSILNSGFKWAKIYKYLVKMIILLSPSRYSFSLIPFPKLHVNIIPEKLYLRNYNVYAVYLTFIAMTNDN